MNIKNEQNEIFPFTALFVGAAVGAIVGFLIAPIGDPAGETLFVWFFAVMGAITATCCGESIE